MSSNTRSTKAGEKTTQSTKTSVNLTALSSLKLNTSGALKACPGMTIQVIYDAGGGVPQSVALVDRRGEQLTREDLMNIMSLESKLKKLQLGLNKGENSSQTLEIAFAYGATVSTVLANVTRALHTLEPRKRNLEYFLNAMIKAQDVAAKDPLALILWAFICAQSHSALKAADEYLRASVTEVSTQKFEDFCKENQVTNWFLKNVFREEPIDLEGKVSLTPVFTYSHTLYFSNGELSFRDVVKLHNVVCFDVYPRPLTVEDMLKPCTKVEREKFEATRSQLDKEKILEGYSVAQVFLSSILDHVGKSKPDVIVKACDAPLDKNTPGLNTVRQLHKLAYLSAVANKASKSASDAGFLAAAVAFNLPASKSLENLADLRAILDANPDKVELYLDFNLHLIKDGGKKELTPKGKLLGMGVACAAPTLEAEVIKDITMGIAEHHEGLRKGKVIPAIPPAAELIRPTVHKFEAKGRGSDGFQDFLNSRNLLARNKAKEAKKKLVKGQLHSSTKRIIKEHGGLPEEAENLIGLIKHRDAQLAAAVFAGSTTLALGEENDDEGSDEEPYDY